MGDTSIADTTRTTGTPFLRKIWLSDTFLTTRDTHPSTAVLEASIGRKDMESQGSGLVSHCRPSAFNGVIITYEVDPRRGFTRPSMISVWNGPRQTFSHTVTSSSMFTSGDPPQAPSSRVSAPSGLGTTVPNWHESSHTNLVVDHGVVRLSILLSWITLISLLIVQVSMTKGTLRPKSDLSGTTRNTTSSS